MSQNLENYLLDKYATKNTYMSKYSGSVAITILTLLTFTVAFGYNHYQAQLKFLKKNWNTVKCNPLIIPFAGLINAPKGESAMNYTEKNLNECMYDVLEDIVEVEKAAHSAAQTIASETVSGLDEALNSVRSLVSEIRSSISSVFSGIFSKIHNTMIPIQNIMIKSQNNINNSQAVLSTAMYTGVGSILSLRSFLAAFSTIIIMFILLLSVGVFPVEIATGSGLSLIPFVGWALAIPFFAAAAVTIGLVIAIVAIFVPFNTTLQQILTNTQKIKSSSYCFDEDTEILLKSGEKKKIKDLIIGDELEIDGKVTALIKLSSKDQTMFKLRNNIISGTHSYLDEYGDINYVRNHPESIMIENYYKPYIYCINTESKYIHLDNITFFDWDEITDEEVKRLKMNLSEILPKQFKKHNIHSYLDSGFKENTKVELEDGRSINIKDVEINDILKFGENILGIVKIDAKNINNIQEYKINNNYIMGSNNLVFKDETLGRYNSTINMTGIQKIKPKYLYHLITDTKTFKINDITFFDYTFSLEHCLINDTYVSSILTY
jgi:hypothetical protein